MTYSIDLTWQLSPDDATLVDEYRIYRKEGSIPDTTTTNQVGTVSQGTSTYTDSIPETRGKSYYWQVTAVRIEDGGSTVKESDSLGYRSFKLVEKHTIDLTWDQSATNSLVDEYRIYRDTETPVSLTDANQVNTNPLDNTTTSYTDTVEDIPGTTYYWVVTAVRIEDGGSTEKASESSTKSFSIPGGDGTPEIKINHNGTTKQVSGAKVQIEGELRDVTSIKVRQNGSLEDIL